MLVAGSALCGQWVRLQSLRSGGVIRTLEAWLQTKPGSNESPHALWGGDVEHEGRQWPAPGRTELCVDVVQVLLHR